MRHSGKVRLLVAGAMLALAACGGGNGSTGIGFVPAPPAPPPSPPPPPPGTSAPFGIATDMEFPTVGDDVDIRWNHAAKAYDLRLPAGDWQRLTEAGGDFYPPSGEFGIHFDSMLNFTHTKRAIVFENGWGYPIGQFAFGMPTAAADMPKTGSASYDAQVWGTGTTPGSPAGQYYEVNGSALLLFDFGAGTLSGSMHAKLTGPAGTFEAPAYAFANTVYGSGSTTFSGSFAVPNASGSSSFSGQFTGPGAAELMAQWNAPFRDETQTSGPVEGTMSGIWIGRKN